MARPSAGPTADARTPSLRLTFGLLATLAMAQGCRDPEPTFTSRSPETSGERAAAPVRVPPVDPQDTATPAPTAHGSEMESSETEPSETEPSEPDDAAPEVGDGHALAPEESEEGEPQVEPLEVDPELMEQTVGVALEAAAAAEVGASECQAAYASLVATLRAVEERLPGHTRPAPPRAAFLSVCQDLGPDMQRCLRPRYATDNVEECRAASEAIDPELRARLERLLGSP